VKVDDELVAAVAPIVEGLGFDLIEVQSARAGRRRIVRILADRPQGGIALADCERISRALAVAFEETPLAAGPYTIEVSSPGLDRPLVTVRDFQRYTGETVTLHLVDDRTLEGTLAGADDDHVILSGKEPIPRVQIKYGTRNY
jgi:ribosome maturation factor RimP